MLNLATVSFKDNTVLYFFSAVLVALMSGFAYSFVRKITRKPFLNNERQKITLVDKVKLTPDTYQFRFQYSECKRLFGLPCGQHVILYGPNQTGVVPGEWNGKPDPTANATEITHKYTPVSLDTDVSGYVDFIIKIYRKNVPNFPDGGKLTTYLDTLKTNDTIEVCGPVGRTIYYGNGHFLYQNKFLPARKHLGLVAAGSGITPILQVIYKSFSDPSDQTCFSLVFANKTPADIIERDVLDQFQELYPKRFQVWYVVNSIPEDQKIENKDWKYDIGYVTSDILKDHLPPVSNNAAIAICGPGVMMQTLVQPALVSHGWDLTMQIITF